MATSSPRRETSSWGDDSHSAVDDGENSPVSPVSVSSSPVPATKRHRSDASDEDDGSCDDKKLKKCDNAAVEILPLDLSKTTKQEHSERASSRLVPITTSMLLRCYLGAT